MKTKTDPNAGDGGFTLVQLMTVLAIGGSLAAAALSVHSKFTGKAAAEELRSDVRTINRAVDIYRAFGGDLEGVSSPVAVISKLQTRADAASAVQTAGLTGSMLDRRLRPVLLPDSDADSAVARALWDAGDMRFVIATEGENGIVRFDIDEALAGQAVAEEARVQDLKLSSANGWIWDYGDSSAPSSSGPTQILNVYAVNNPPGSGEGPGGEGGGGGGGGGSSTPLDPPVFSLPGGSYAAPSFDLPLALSNPNPAGVSRIIYRVAGGPLTSYTGPIAVQPGNQVTAFAESVVPSQWTNSGDAANGYSASMVYLDDPSITTSATAFDFAANETVLVTIDHENDELYATLEYRLDGGAWQEYGAPLSLDAADYPHPASALIEARVVATPAQYPEYYEGSETVSAQVQAAPLPLNAPLISFSDDGFSGVIFNGVYTDGSGLAGSGAVPGGGDWNDSDALVAEFRWKWGGWQAVGGSNPGAVTIMGTQTSHSGSPKSIDFVSTTALDSVFVKKFYSSSHTINFEPATTAGYGIVNANNNSFTRVQFYYNGSVETSGELMLVNTVTVTLSDPDNVPGTSQLRYKVVERDEANTGYTVLPEDHDTEGFLEYTGPFEVTSANYPDGFGIEAYADSPSGSHLPSRVAFDQIEETPLLTISGSASGLFLNPTGGSGMVTNLDGGGSGSYFEWGTGANGSDPSSIEFTGSGFTNVNDGERFLIGTIDYFNGTIWSGTGANTVDLALSLNFDLGEERTFEFNLELINTPNNTGTLEGDADYVYLYDILSLSTTMIYDWDFDLRIEFGETTVNGFSTIDQFHVFEGESATGNIYGTLLLHE